MVDIFSNDARRNPYPLYDQARAASPVLKVPPPFDAWLIFDYDGVKRALHDHEVFSSAVPAPPHWLQKEARGWPFPLHQPAPSAAAPPLDRIADQTHTR